MSDIYRLLHEFDNGYGTRDVFVKLLGLHVCINVYVESRKNFSFVSNHNETTKKAPADSVPLSKERYVYGERNKIGRAPRRDKVADVLKMESQKTAMWRY